jgi:hypothetical protein
VTRVVNIENGIRFDDGCYARVNYVEREAYVDVVHFYFVGRLA